MGMLIEARCGCGYVADRLMFGAPMSSFETHCAVPARCETCREVVVVDWVAAGPCPACGGSVVPYLSAGGSGGSGGMTWRAPGSGEQLVLPASGSVCPRCREPELGFAVTGMFD
jgi:hypothetical protein